MICPALDLIADTMDGMWSKCSCSPPPKAELVFQFLSPVQPMVCVKIKLKNSTMEFDWLTDVILLCYWEIRNIFPCNQLLKTTGIYFSFWITNWYLFYYLMYLCREFVISHVDHSSELLRLAEIVQLSTLQGICTCGLSVRLCCSCFVASFFCFSKILFSIKLLCSMVIALLTFIYYY